ncbi:hypothetical protein T484DRAFT_1791487 [Baffinella frigidus]|nr:hypothetical protein T484DRAFT_1791487 [Cryptophyta sp. CCMP2293]
MAAMSASLSLLDSMIASLESSLGVAPVKQGKPNPGKPAKPAAAAAAAAGKPAPAAAAPAGKPDSAPAGEKPDAPKEKKEKKEKPAAAPAAAPAADDQPEFTKLEMKVGVLIKTWHHPESEKLFLEEVDVGEEKPRQVASGLRAHFTLETFCPGRKVVVVTNLKAAKMAGAESAGMVVACVHPEGKVELLDPPADAKQLAPPANRVRTGNVGHVIRGG